MMMKTMGNSPFKIFDELRELGFIAGVTLKGPWEDQVNVYEYIQQGILPPNCRMVIPNQVHGAHINHIANETIPGEFDADGVITSLDDTCLTVTTADCLSLLAADPVSGYFAAIHVGWRSFVAGIIDNYFQIARELGMDISQTHLFSGPSIGSCCFKVGPEVAALFDKEVVENRNGNLFIDLRRAVWNNAISHGVAKEHIGGIINCTSCDPERYYSYRRDKQSPVQMVTFIYKSII